MDNIIESSEEDYLYTKNSQIQNSGKGLFTAIPIYKEEIIAIFKGNVLNAIQAKAIAEKNEDQYFINLLDGKTLDSKNVECFAKYANDASGYSKSVFKNNAKIALDENKNVCLIALRKIKAGEEIFCSYGKKYWKQYM
jgi:uncharacterized protein